MQGTFGGPEASQGNSTTAPTESLRASGLRNPCKPQGPESAGADLPQWSLSPSVVGGAICEQSAEHKPKAAAVGSSECCCFPFFPPSSHSLLNSPGNSQAPFLKPFRGLAGTGAPPSLPSWYQDSTRILTGQMTQRGQKNRVPAKTPNTSQGTVPKGERMVAEGEGLCALRECRGIECSRTQSCTEPLQRAGMTRSGGWECGRGLQLVT